MGSSWGEKRLCFTLEVIHHNAYEQRFHSSNLRLQPPISYSVPKLVLRKRSYTRIMHETAKLLMLARGNTTSK